MQLAQTKPHVLALLTDIDDYLICSHSLEQEVRDSTTVINHLKDLGFNINWAKSRVEPTQCTEYLSLNINSLSLRVTRSEGRLASLTHCISLFRLGSCIIQTMPALAWTHGFSDICCTSGASNDEVFSGLGCSITPVLTLSP